MNIEHATSNGEWVHGSPFSHGKKILFKFNIQNGVILRSMLDVGRSDVRRSSVIHSERIYDNHYNGVPRVFLPGIADIIRQYFRNSDGLRYGGCQNKIPVEAFL